MSTIAGCAGGVVGVCESHESLVVHVPIDVVVYASTTLLHHMSALRDDVQNAKTFKVGERSSVAGPLR